jgi:hypothetical protein
METVAKEQQTCVTFQEDVTGYSVTMGDDWLQKHFHVKNKFLFMKRHDLNLGCD